MTWTITWPDGDTLSADTAEGVLARLGEDGWNQPDVAHALCDRAFDLLGVDVSPALPAPDLLRALDQAGFLQLAVM